MALQQKSDYVQSGAQTVTELLSAPDVTCELATAGCQGMSNFRVIHDVSTAGKQSPHSHEIKAP